METLWVADEIRDAVPGAQIAEHVGLYQVWVASRYVNIWDDGADKLVWEFGDGKPSSKTDEERADEAAARALAQLENLRGCDVHTSTILGSVDEGIFRSLGIQVTNEPVYATKSLYRKK